MAVYNGAETLAQALDTVRDQTYRDYEILVVDDGSSDRSGSIAKQFGARVISVPNGGLGAARKRLVEEATGELIAFIDRDDFWLPEKLELQISLMDESRADLVHTDGLYIYPGGIELARDLDISPLAHAFDHILPNNRVIASSAVFRRQAMLDVGNFVGDTVRCSDWYGWMMLATRHKFVHLPKRLVRYNVLATSLANAGYKFHAAQHHVLTEHFLPRKDEIFSTVSVAARNRYVKMLVRDAGIALSAMARHKKRDGEFGLARELAMKALITSPDVLRVWTRAFSVSRPEPNPDGLN